MVGLTVAGFCLYQQRVSRRFPHKSPQETGIKDPNFRVHEKASKDPRSDLRSALRASSKVKPRRSPAARTTQALASLLCFRKPCVQIQVHIASAFNPSSRGWLEAIVSTDRTLVLPSSNRKVKRRRSSVARTA